MKTWNIRKPAWGFEEIGTANASQTFLQSNEIHTNILSLSLSLTCQPWPLTLSVDPWHQSEGQGEVISCQNTSLHPNCYCHGDREIRLALTAELTHTVKAKKKKQNVEHNICVTMWQQTHASVLLNNSQMDNYIFIHFYSYLLQLAQDL